MKVVIPVAGVGTRLRPHTNTLPKPLLEVAGKPILAYILDPLEELDLEEVIFVIGYKGDQIKDYVTENYSFKSVFIYQDELLGLGYAVNLTLPKAAGSDLLIILGDTIAECCLKEFTRAGDFVLGVRQVDDPERFGIAAVKEGFVTQVVEKSSKPPSNLALIGVYYFKDTVILQNELEDLVQSGAKTGGEFQLTDALQGMIQSGVQFVPFEVEGWHDCGKKETMLATNQHFLEKLTQPKQIDGCTLVPPVYISDSAKVEQSTIGPFVSVGDKAEISDSEIANSIIGKGSQISNAHIKDSLVGQSVVISGYKGILNLGDDSEIHNC